MNGFTSMSALLDELSPDLPAQGSGWGNVLARAGVGPRLKRRRLRGRIVVALALVAAAAVPLALAAVNDWWFFDFRDAPRSLSNEPVVVTKGTWSGHAWELAAYASAEGTCWALTFPGSSEIGGAGAMGGRATSHADNALGCGGIVGLRPPNPRALHGPTVMYMLGGSDVAGYPSWISGPVVASATSVVVRFRDGAVVRVPTSAPFQLGHVGWYGPVRFFAAQYPDGVTPYQSPQTVTGLDSSGNVVACASETSTYRFFSPLTDCSNDAG
jgi:hypothetical protein